MKRIDGMGGNPRGLSQGAQEPWGHSRAGRSVPVSSMPLTGPGAARGKPPRGRAGRRHRQVRAHAVGVNRRGSGPLSQDLACWDRACGVRVAAVRSPRRCSLWFRGCHRMTWRHLRYPTSTREPREAGRGWSAHHPRHDAVESITGNRGEPTRAGKESACRAGQSSLKPAEVRVRRQRGHRSRGSHVPPGRR
jgi:hypothetical protein